MRKSTCCTDHDLWFSVLGRLLGASVASTSSETTAQPEADRNHRAGGQDLMLPAQLCLLTRHHQHSGKTVLTKQDTWLERPSTTLSDGFKQLAQLSAGKE